MSFFSFIQKQVRKNLPARISAKIVLNSSGFTLVEFMVVILLIGIIARVALPTATSYQGDKVELAATEIAMAIRFARDDAIRTGEERGVAINNSTGQVTVYRPDLTTSPVSIDSVLYNPLTKQPYDFNIQESELTAGVSIGNTDDIFKYRNYAARQNDLFFDDQGMPVFISGTDRYHLETGSIIIQSGSDTSDVVVTPFTGRIGIQ